MGDQRTRVAWRCRRGMLELDLLLQGFLARGYGQLGREGEEAFGRLLCLPDPLLYRHLIGMEHFRERELQNVVEAIRSSVAP